jgi:Calcipressin
MEDENEFYVNEVDGLACPTLPYENSDEPENAEQDDTLDDLPTSLIVTNIHSEVFNSEELKAEMESLFGKFSDNVTFQWLKSFRRLRVNYDNAVSAGNAN